MNNIILSITIVYVIISIYCKGERGMLAMTFISISIMVINLVLAGFGIYAVILAIKALKIYINKNS